VPLSARLPYEHFLNRQNGVKRRRRTLQQSLEQTDRHVTLAEKHIEQQRRLIEELERRGCDPGDAMRLLRLFEALQKEYVYYRDYLRRRAEDPGN
jgi:predicted ATPase